MSNTQFVAFQDVNEDYAWVNYGQFKLLMMKRNGYVNVTKMCENYSNKKFIHWKENKRSKELIIFISTELKSIGIPIDPLVTIMTGENDLRGTYAHPDLVLDIACWLSGEFYLKASKIVREYFNKQERERLEELHRIALASHQAEINKIESEKSELQKIRERLEKEFERADEERKLSELRYIEMCKKYDIQYDNIVGLKDNIVGLKDNIVGLKDNIVGLKDNIVGLKDNIVELNETNNTLNNSVVELKENTNILIQNQDDLLESSKVQIDMLEYIMEENNELKEEVNEVKEQINVVSTKLGISVEDRVPKTKINSKLEIFILLKKNNFVKSNKKDFQYYVICCQIGYSNSKSKKMIREEDYSEIFRIEYTPNTKNLLHRLKEQKYNITFSSNKFNTEIHSETLIGYIKEINGNKNNVEI
jgi:predicted  nucleic acid-binding Zn-ribbon protein